MLLDVKAYSRDRRKDGNREWYLYTKLEQVQWVVSKFVRLNLIQLGHCHESTNTTAIVPKPAHQSMLFRNHKTA